MREERVMRRGSPELVMALKNGEVSARIADELIRLTPARAKRELERRLRAVQERERKSKAIASVIRSYLNGHQKVDLEALRSLIQAALA
jgi:hypothetical protein